MKTLGVFTRNFSYHQFDLETLGTRQQEVLEAIQKGPKSRRQIAEYLKLPINSITGRVKELLQKRIIEEFGIIDDPVTGRPVTILRVCFNESAWVA